MNKKFISVFMMGAATLAPLSTLVSCSDYDDDINNLQAQIDASGVNLKEEVSKLQKLLDECKAAAEKADADLEQAIKNATNDAKGYADIQAEQAKQAAIAALQAQLSQAIADLENGAIADAKARAEQAYNLAEQTSKLANSNKAELEKLAKELETVNTDLQKAIEALQARMTAAEAAIAKGANSETTAYAQGVLNLAKGNYAQAEQNFDDATCNSAALAQILNKNYAKATSTLRAIKNRDAMTEYLTAIVNARQGNTSAAADALKLALQKDPSLAAYAANDIELAKVSK